MAENNKLSGIGEIAGFTGISKPTAKKLISRGKFRAYRISDRKIVAFRNELEEDIKNLPANE